MNTDRSGRFVRILVLGTVLIVFLALGGGMWVILNRGEELGLNAVVEQPEVYGRDRATVDQLLWVPPELAVIGVEYEYIDALDVPPDERQYMIRGRRAMVVALHVDPEASSALEGMIRPFNPTTDAEFSRTMPCLRTPCLPDRYFDRRGARILKQPKVWAVDLAWFGTMGGQVKGWAIYDGDERTVYIYRVIGP